jgi:2-keto-3-deoxy-L-rhamnonate aldolase RhmA
MGEAQNFRQRLLSGERLIGSYLKTPSPIVAEVMALSDLDCLCLDAEHAPFDRLSIDGCVAMARAAGMASLVRLPTASPEHILNALDCGATGVVAPHICSAEQAQAFAKAGHYGERGRGYAGSSRAAGYTTRKMADHLAASATQTTLIAQIEDPIAVDNIDAIAGVDGIDALFVGRVDLTVAYGAASQDDPVVMAAVEKICAAGLRHNRRLGMFLARPADVAFWADKGASLFLLGSDHAFLLDGAARLVAQCR